MQRSNKRSLWKIGLVALLALEVGWFAYLQLTDSEQAPAVQPVPTVTVAPDEASPTVSPDPLAQTGFSITPADGWKSEPQGLMTIITSPDGAAVMAVGPGPDGSLGSATTQLLDMIDVEYSAVEVFGRKSVSIDSKGARFVHGVASNENGVKLRWVAAVIEGSGTNYAITGFSDETLEAKMRIKEMRRTIGSFRTG